MCVGVCILEFDTHYVFRCTIMHMKYIACVSIMFKQLLIPQVSAYCYSHLTTKTL